MTTATVQPVYPHPSLRDATAAEWTKLRSMRSTWVSLAVALLVSAGLSLAFTFASTTTFHTMNAAQKASFDSVGTTLVGVNLGLILFAVLGTMAASSEYASGMMRLTLIITPSRARVLAAKAIVVAVPSIVFGIAFAVISFLTGQAVINGADPALAVGITGPNVLSTLLNWGPQDAALALMALALGIMLRSAAGAIATAIGILFGPLIIGTLLPAWFQSHIIAYLPSSAAGNLTNPKPDITSSTYLPPAIAGCVLGAWVVAFLVGAYLVMSKRDSG